MYCLFAQVCSDHILRLTYIHSSIPLGPYAPAILRFQVAFPSRYPNSAPLVTFTSDIFHPLVSPLTTYTHTGTSASDTVSATDEERLPPGGFSLRHGFPTWFEKEEKDSGGLETSRDVKVPTLENKDGFRSPKNEGTMSPSSVVTGDPVTFNTTSAKRERQHPASTSSTITIVEVLQYMKKSFEDVSFLDELPLEGAGNTGAWKAWRAYLEASRSPRSDTDDERNAANTPQRKLGAISQAKPSNDWSWSGIWEQRVREGIESSISNPVLYGGSDGDDLVCLISVIW